LKTLLRNPVFRVLFVSFCLLAAGAGLRAQTAGEQPAPEQPAAPVQHIGTIQVKFVGLANVSEQIVRSRWPCPRT
jgi:hypothetical protein